MLALFIVMALIKIVIFMSYNIMSHSAIINYFCSEK